MCKRARSVASGRLMVAAAYGSPVLGLVAASLSAFHALILAAVTSASSVSAPIAAFTCRR